MSDLFASRVKNFPGDDLMSFNLAAVAEALDLIQKLSDENVGGEVVESRLGEYKSWDPDVFKVDKDAEDGYVARLKERGQAVVMLSEEAERLEIGTESKDAEAFVVSDPFDGSYLFKRGIPDFWYSSLAFFNLDGSPRCCAVGDGVHKTIAFANADGAFISKLEGDQLVNQFKLNKQYREAAGRSDVTDLTKASIESYAMKPKKFLLPIVDNFRTVMEPFKFYLPNGGPYGFVDVAEGKIDCYFAPRQPFVDIFSGIYVAEQAEAVVTDFDGNPVKFEDNVHGLYDVVASTNRNLHDQVLGLIAKCK
jgi:fructose-1,6-bisphosphatase/inositol monophosphatase family enzyme